jgi:glycosyltransferase involved in cell wall biosynthesis
VHVGVVLEQCLAPVPGGTGRYSREIAAALVRRAPAGAVVEGVTAWHNALADAVVPGVDGPRRLRLGRRALIAAWERGRGPSVPGDLVHAPTPLAPPRRQTPLVVTVHDAVPWTHPETLTPRGVRWHRTAVERAASTADLVVVPTHAVAAELARHVEIDADRLRVIGEGVSGDLDLPVDAEARAARMALPERFLLTVATLEPRKGLDVLLEALADARAPRLPLLVAGQPGWGGLDPLAEAARLGIAGRVRVLGRVPDADLAVLLHRATALVVPSRAEGFGLPLLEAMAAGTPVVTSTDAALCEVGGDAALAAPDEELPAALHRVAEDRSLQAVMAVAGRLRAASYTWDGAADALWRAYGDIA